MKAFDITPIIYNFYHDIYENDKRSNWEAYYLLIMPVAFAQVAVIRPITSEFMTMMASALAILFGFTFSSLLTTAKYSAKDDRIEEEVVKQTRLGTSYALLMNLLSLIAVILVSIAVPDYTLLSQPVAATVSAAVYCLLFHYLLVMVYLMRYLYLLAIGGALEPVSSSQTQREEGNEREIKL